MRVPVRTILSKDETKVYVVNEDSDNISIVNTHDNLEIKTIKVGHDPQTAELSKDGSKLYVGNSKDYSVSVIDTVKDEVTQVIKLPN